MSSLTPRTLYSPPKTCQSSPSTRGEPKVTLLLYLHMNGKGDSVISSRPNRTPMPSGSPTTQSLSNCRPSVTSIELGFPLSSPISHQPQLDIQDKCSRMLTAHAIPPVETQVDGDCLDEVLVPPPNSPVAVYGSSGSTSIHVSDTKGGNWKNDAGVREVYWQATRKVGAAVGGEELTRAPCAHPHPVRLNSTQTEATGKLVTVPARTLSPSFHP